MLLANLIEDLQYIAIGPGAWKYLFCSEDDRQKVDAVIAALDKEPWVAAVIYPDIRLFSSANDATTCMGKIVEHCSRAVRESAEMSLDECNVFVEFDHLVCNFRDVNSDKALVYIKKSTPVQLTERDSNLFRDLGINRVKFVREVGNVRIPMSRDFIALDEVATRHTRDIGDFILLFTMIWMISSRRGE